MPKDKNADSEEEKYRKKVDMCITDAIVKGGGGILLGTLASIIIFKKRWPITTGLGIGLGFSFANCGCGVTDTTLGHTNKIYLVSFQITKAYYKQNIHSGTPVTAFSLFRNQLTTT